MVEVTAFQPPEDLMRPEVKTAEQRSEDRLTQLETEAIATVNDEFSDFLQLANPEGSARTSRFERGWLEVFRTKNRIRDVLAQAGANYASTLSITPGAHAGVESRVWELSRKSTLDAIMDRKRSADASLMVADGFESILGTTISTLEQQWEDQSSLAEQYFEQRGLWGKISGLFQKSRFDRFSKKFTDKLTQQKDNISASIQAVKNHKRQQLDVGQRRIEQTFDHITEDADKTRYWGFIRDVIETPNHAAFVRASSRYFSGAGWKAQFHLPTNFSEADFLEIVNKMDFADGVIQIKKSESMWHDAEEKLENYSTRESLVRTTPLDYEGLIVKLQGYGIKSAEDEVLDTNGIVKKLEVDFAKQGIDLLAHVYGTPIKGLVKEEKIFYFIDYLNSNPDVLDRLEVSLQRELLQYLEDLKDERSDDYEDMTLVNDLDNESEEVRNQMVALFFPPVGPVTDTFQTLGAHLNVDDFDEDEYKRVMRNHRDVLELFDRRFSHFDKEKENISSAHRERIEEVWNQLNSAKEKAQRVVDEWKKDVENFKKLESNLPLSPPLELKNPTGGVCFTPSTTTSSSRVEIAEDWLKYYRELQVLKESERGAIYGDGKADTAKVKALTDEISSANKDLLSLNENLTRFRGVRFTEPEIFDTDYTGIGRISIVRPRPPRVSASVSINERIHNRLRNDFLNRVREQYWDYLEDSSNKQWNLLQKIPEGVTVSLSFRDTTGGGSLESPHQLKAGEDKKTNLRVIHKEAGMLKLENDTHIFVLNGPLSVQSSKMPANMGVYRKVARRGSPVSGMGGAGTSSPDYMITASEPNQEAIVLNMRIH